MVPKVVLSCVPRPKTTAMIATEMPAAIRPYSMAVAPDSFFRNATSLDICGFPLLGWAHLNLESATRGHYDAFLIFVDKRVLILSLPLNGLKARCRAFQKGPLVNSKGTTADRKGPVPGVA